MIESLRTLRGEVNIIHGIVHRIRSSCSVELFQLRLVAFHSLYLLLRHREMSNHLRSPARSFSIAS